MPDSKYHSVAAAFEDPDLFCSSAAALMVDNFGAESLNWEPETVEAELRVLNVHPSDDTLDRIHAVASLLTTEAFHNDFGAFCVICAALNRSRPSFERLDPPSLDEVAWACAEARLLEGPESFDSHKFSEDIALYVGQLLSDSGMTKPPDMLKFALLDPEEQERRDQSLSVDEFTFKSYWDSHDALLKEVEADIKAKAVELSSQLKRLPLKNGDPDFLKTLPA